MQANRRLSAQWLRLQRANGFKNEILGTVAHDLKNPLGVILGRTEMLTELISTARVQGKRHRPDRAHPRRHQAADLDGRPSDLGCDGGRLRHHHPPRAGRRRRAGERGRGGQPAARGQQAADHRGVGAAEHRHDVRHRPHPRGDRQSRLQRHQILADRRQDLGGGRSRGRQHRHPRHRPGRGPVAGGSRPAVRPLPAPLRKAHRRRKLDRPRAFHRQAHHRHAWRRGDRHQPRPRTRARPSPSPCPRPNCHDPEPAHHHRRRRGAGPRDGRRLSQDARLHRDAVRRRQEPARRDRDRRAARSRGARPQHARGRRALDHPRPQEPHQRSRHHADRDREPDRPRGRARARRRRLCRQALRTARIDGAHPLGAAAERRRPRRRRPQPRPPAPRRPRSSWSGSAPNGSISKPRRCATTKATSIR